MKFDVVQSKAVPKTLSHEVEISKPAKKVVDANQNSFIHIEFAVIKIFDETNLIYYVFWNN